ncbi:MAG: hypothetical protein K2Q06_04280, partial [Parvularculaceae bacterium]|nr:hypothetical protein [Parvularculaceae bacterium]
MRMTVLLTMLCAAALAGCAKNEPAEAPKTIRIATFNASLNRAAEGGLIESLSTPDDPQAKAVAEII